MLQFFKANRIKLKTLQNHLFPPALTQLQIIQRPKVKQTYPGPDRDANQAATQQAGPAQTEPAATSVQ